MKFDVPIRTERLLLRLWRPNDLDVYAALRGSAEVVRYLYDEPLTRDEAETKLTGLPTEIGQLDVFTNLAVELVATGEVAGNVGLVWKSDIHRHAEIGYLFLEGHRGHGYATEAAAAVVNLAFNALGAHRVTGQLDARNIPSSRVLERLGMRREAHLIENEFVKGEWTDEIIYAVLDRQWRYPLAPLAPSL